MLVKYHLAPVPYTSLVHDMVTREGPPGEDNFPLNGMLDVIMKKSGKTPRAVVFEYLCAHPKDYNFTHKSRDYPNGYPATTIEEVPANLVETYITQLLYGITNYNKDGVREYSDRNSREQRALRDNDSGDVIYESELLAEKQEYSLEEYLAWQRQLPYLIKRLHAKSVTTGFHVMSAVRARAQCHADKITVTPKNLIARKIFMCDANGDCRGLVTENIGAFQQYFGKWIRGHEDVRDGYYDDMQELCYICMRLGIDLSKENPLRYTGAFTKSLVSDYIIKNYKVYVNAASEIAGGTLPHQVRKIIANMRLDDLDSLETIVTGPEFQNSELSLSTCIEHVQLMFMNSKLYKDFTDKIVSQDDLDKFALLYYKCTGRLVNVRRMTIINDYLCKSQMEMLTLPVAPFATDPSGMGNHAILHRSGIFILYHPDRLNQSFAYLDIERLCSYLRKYDKTSEEKRPKLNFKWEVYNEAI